MKFHWSEIQNIAKAHHCEEPVQDLETFQRFLRFWWCRHFNRPMKDPLLREYTLDELCYEFLRYYYMNPDNDPKKELEAKQVQEDEDAWIKEQMARISGAQKVAAQAVVESPSPSHSQANDLPDIFTQFDE